MAIEKIEQVKVPTRLSYEARSVVTKHGILKNRSKELQGLLGRIKELLGEDEVLIIASNETLGEVTRRPVIKKKADPYIVVDEPIGQDKTLWDDFWKKQTTNKDYWKEIRTTTAVGTGTVHHQPQTIRYYGYGAELTPRPQQKPR